MAILKIARMGHPVLRRIADPISDPTSPEIAGLVADMLDTLADIDGVGLAAPQVHVPLRLVIFHVPTAGASAERYKDAGLEEEDDGVAMTMLINPQIEQVGEDTNTANESCLSVPDMMGRVERFSDIIYRGLDLDGNGFERRASGFHARVVQHECDHLDGILYPQRMTDLSTFGYNEELRKSFAEDDEPTAEPNEE
ncbi:MAG TPA: peptide deformylase [Rhodospirillales bacterium]|nr:peptide deformylase [Rhodospirillales bacterium]